jgi:hypothetical protein
MTRYETKYAARLIASGVLLLLLIASRQTSHAAQSTFFVEEQPAWNRADLSIVALEVKPDRLEPGQRAILRATVRNVGTGDAVPGHVTFRIGNREVAKVRFGALAASTSTSVETVWTAEENPDRRVFAALVLDSQAIDWRTENNVQETIVYVRSTGRESPAFAVHAPRVDPAVPSASGQALITIKLRNLGFVEKAEAAVSLRVDDTLLFDDRPISLGPGEEHSLQAVWKSVEPGQHLLKLASESAVPVFSKDFACTDWLLQIPQQTLLYKTFQKDQWVSIGPKILNNGSVGRVDRIAIDPNDPNVLYAGANSGGLWKSIDGGSNWEPLTDRLPAMRIGAIAIDPRFPATIYIGTGHPFYGGGGIFKSVDGGKTWHAFATEFEDKTTVPAARRPLDGIGKIILRYDSAGQILIYTTTRHGLLRYVGSKPFATSTQPSEWQVIKQGTTYDVAVDPVDSARVYLPVYEEVTNSAGNKQFLLEAVFRTDRGMTATGDGDWQPMKGLPPKQELNGMTTLDVFPLDTKVLFAAITRGLYTRVYQSEDGGDSWRLAFLQRESYNEFIRVHPTNKSQIYFGGIELWQANWYADLFGWGATGVFSGWQTRGLLSGHADQKAMTFLPRGVAADPDAYYLVNDGGVWYCDKLSGPFSDYVERCTPRNNDLRVTQFYDIDSSPTQSALIIGGTQDNGTVLFRGDPVWQQLKGGDGNYSLIGPGSDPVMYAQHQCLNDDWGTQRRVGLADDWQDAKNGLPKDRCWASAQIVQHPKDPDQLMAQGNEIHYTQDGGQSWHGLGPTNKKGTISRLGVQPYSGDRWVFGTSEGQIWQRAGNWMTKQFEHPDGVAVAGLAFSPVDPRILYATFIGGRFSHRIIRFELPPNVAGEWKGDPIAEGFPCNLTPTAVSGDGYRADVVYVGTEKGVFRWIGSAAPNKRWQPYNDGLPWVDIRDLQVELPSKRLLAGTWGRGVWSVVTGP